MPDTYNVPQSGVTADTPKKILFGAGTIHKGLKFDTSKKTWNFKESLVGATSGGSKFEIVPEVTAPEIDGVLVAVKGLDVKTGETANMEINFIELTADIMKSALIAESKDSDVEGYSLIESKPNIKENDYWDNVSFVGKTIDGKPIIVIMDNSLCTSGLSMEGKNKEAGVGKYTFRCSQEITEDLSVLPYHIYYPTVSA